MDREELITKVRYLVDTHYSGDYGAALNAYAKHDGKLDADELVSVLKDAGVGNMLTRMMWASRIISIVDRDGDGKIDRAEFDFVFRK